MKFAPRLKHSMVVVAKTLGLIVFAIGVLVVAFAVFFFATPEFHMTSEQIAHWLKKIPGEVVLDATRIEVRLIRPEGLPFAKRLVLHADDLCVRYGTRAVDSCFDRITVAVTGGWGGKRLEGESWLKPRLIAIEPLELRRGRVSVDLTAFPPSKPKRDKGGVSVLDLFRKEILPKWKLEGSYVGIEKFFLRSGALYVRSRLTILTSEDSTLRADLSDLHVGDEKGETLEADLNLRLLRPRDLFRSGLAETENASRDKIPPRAWKVFADGRMRLADKREVALNADADVANWQRFDYRIGLRLKNIANIRELRFNGSQNRDLAQGKFSLAMGSRESEIQALDFVNCGFLADLGKKIGSLACGPQAVRLQIKERTSLRSPKLFVFEPEFELKLTNVVLGADKGADFTFDLALDHAGLTKSSLHFEGGVVLEAPEDEKANGAKPRLKFNLFGGADIRLESFRKVVELLRRTPYAIPAPFAVLDGPVLLGVRVDLNEEGGEIPFQLRSELDSRHQAAHLLVDGRTTLIPAVKGLHPSIDMTVQIEDLRLSAPRLDLKVPPQIAYDNRFGPIEDPREVERRSKSPASPPDITIRVLTTRSNAIRIATNLTSDAIPIELDVFYASSGVFLRAQVPRAVAEAVRHNPPQPATVGFVHIGRTPVEIFRRKALLESLRLALKPSGEKVVDGRVAVTYLDYDIGVLIGGSLGQTQVKLTSDPPLTEDQIVAVLLFGRPLTELDESERESVSNLNAAVTDAVLGVGSLYFLANTPVESIGYDPERQRVTAKVALGGGTTLELGVPNAQSSGVGVKKRLSREWVFRSDVERVGPSSTRTVSAFIEWVKRF